MEASPIIIVLVSMGMAVLIPVMLKVFIFGPIDKHNKWWDGSLNMRKYK